MRILALAILAIGTVSIGPAAAQKYDPAYPVCLHKYGLGGFKKLNSCKLRPSRSFLSGQASDVACWHEPDIPKQSPHVR